MQALLPQLLPDPRSTSLVRGRAYNFPSATTCRGLPRQCVLGYFASNSYLRASRNSVSQDPEDKQTRFHHIHGALLLGAFCRRHLSRFRSPCSAYAYGSTGLLAIRVFPFCSSSRRSSICLALRSLFEFPSSRAFACGAISGCSVPGSKRTRRSTIVWDGEALYNITLLTVGSSFSEML